MTSYLAGLVGDTAPGVALVIVALAAAAPPYMIVIQSAHGRARSAVGYLLGLTAGLAATVAVANFAGAEASSETVATAGLVAAFFAPFAGLARGKWHGVKRPVRRKAAVGFPQ